jgi:thiamine biosynthesis lipoprotein ApbE
MRSPARTKLLIGLGESGDYTVIEMSCDGVSAKAFMLSCTGTIRFTLLSAVVAFWSSPGDLQRVELSDEAMGSTFSIVLYGYDRRQLETAADAAFDEVHRLDRLLSNYKPHSEWSEVNRTAGVRPVKLSAELFQLLSDCMAYSRQSDGAFDITVGPLVKVWGFTKVKARCDRPGVELDPGGIGKGYAVDPVSLCLCGLFSL